jgi:molecular chaperone DnaJ
MTGSTETTSMDYYELLGVERTADGATIKRAYRKLALELHPDRNPDDPTAEERFRTVTAAYEVLSDDEKRSVYDRFGEDGLRQNHWEPRAAAFTDISDIFRAFFGDDAFGAPGGGGRGGQARGENVVVDIGLDLAEAALGTQREVGFEVTVACATCEGKGAESDAGLETCETCSGHGIVRAVTRSLFGQVVQEQACPTCHGRGQRIVDPCSACHGSGEQREQRSVTVDVPAGISDGQRIRFTGRGGAGSNGGPAGNLYVEVHVRPDERFLREGDDLVTVLDVSFTDAALGATCAVATVDDEDVDLEVPAGTQPGTVLTLRHRGMGRLRGSGRGDLRVVCNVVVPRELTAEQKATLAQFRELEHDRNYHHHEGLLDKLRRVLRP